jgi:RNA polymerase sigma-70 factor (ECF subfamily)
MKGKKDSSARDLELLQATADGDQEAFRIFVDAHKNKVLRICFGFVRNREEAEDVAQEVFFKVYRGASGFRGRSAVSTWLYRIAVNCSLNHIRKAKSKAWLPWMNPSVGADEVDQIAGSDEPADDVLERRERRKLLREALDRLPHNQRTAFTLHGIEGFSYEEISRVMDCSLSAVESRIHRAKLNLKKHLTRALKKGK